MNFIANESAQKLRGGYYTPPDLAQFVSRWVLGGGASRILEPSCGDGVFIDALALAAGGKPVSITGFELLEDEAAKSVERARNQAKRLTADIRVGDFLEWALCSLTSGGEAYDAVVGNPPFIRYQYLPEWAQCRAEAIFKCLALPFTKHTNAWVPFVLASIALLKPGGRLGMIIPAEIVHVMHAQGLRSYLGYACSRLLIIDPEEIWFEGTLQGAVILFAQKKSDPGQHGEGLGMMKVKGRGFLAEDPEQLFNEIARINGKTVEGKWTRALLTPRERQLLDQLVEHAQVRRFDEIAEVDVGIVTGANKFFLVTDDVVERFKLHDYAYPMFGRSEHCQGVIYDAEHHVDNAFKGNPTNFLWIRSGDGKLPSRVREYIGWGEEQALHLRYKCSTRTPWYSVPSVHATEVGMLKRAHDVPRLIHNRIGAFTTDTAYRIAAKDTPVESLVFSFLNSLTALSAELEGRHYGGGVLELVPSEIEKLLVPLPTHLEPAVERLDAQVRTQPIEDVLQAQNESVLAALGLEKSDRRLVHDAWRRLKNRRQRVSEEVSEEKEASS